MPNTLFMTNQWLPLVVARKQFMDARSESYTFAKILYNNIILK